jgi:hypothetical protein
MSTSTQEQREARGALIARHLTGRVQRTVPGGVFSWGPAWLMVADADSRCLRALHAWEESGTAEAQAAAQRAGADYVAAWRAAAERWEAVGRPVGEGVSHAA